MSPDVVFDLYRLAQNKTYFWIDDVFVSGMLARDLNITHINLRQKLEINLERLKYWVNSKHLTVPPMFGLSDTDDEDIVRLWNKTALYYRTTFDFDF